MRIGKFKLDHKVEQNNECIIYRGSCEQNKYMIIQLNRQPLLQVELYRKHFQRELSFLFKYTEKPEVIPNDFPFTIPKSEYLQSELIEFPRVLEIHQTDTHYYLICQNCLQGQIINQQIDNPKTFLQIFTLYDLYFQEFKEGRIADRDFSIMRLFRSDDKLTLIDFGFSSLQRQMPKKPWAIKLGELFNVLAKQDSRTKVKNVINTLLVGKIKWDQIKDLLHVSFGFEDQDYEDCFNDKTSKVSRSNSIYSKQQTQTLSMIPQEIISVEQNLTLKSPYQESSKQKSRQTSMVQSKIIQFGNEKQKEHFQKIRQSLSPGYTHTNRIPCRLLPIEMSTQQASPQIRSVSRKTYNFGYNQVKSITKPMDVSYEYRGRSTPRQDNQEQYQQFERQDYKRDVHLYEEDQRKINSLTTNNSQFEQSSNTQTVYQRGQSLNERQELHDFQQVKRPLSSRPQEQKKELKTLLRTSTRELQQPDQIKQKNNQESGVSRTINYSDSQSINQQDFQQKPQIRRNSIRKSSTHSIESVELQNNTTKHQVKLQQINDSLQNKPLFKTPRDQSNLTFKQKQQPFMNNQDYVDTSINDYSKPKTQTIEYQNRGQKQNSIDYNQNQPANEQQMLEINEKDINKIRINKYVQNVQEIRQQNIEQDFEEQEADYVPSFCQTKNNKTTKNNFMLQSQQNNPEQQNQKESQNPQQYQKAQSIDEFYQKTTIQKQNTLKRPPTPQNKKQDKIQVEEIQLITTTNAKTNNQSFNDIDSQNKTIENSQKVNNTPKSVRKFKIDDTKVEKVEIKEISAQLSPDEENQIAIIYENQIKKYDIIGKMVGGNVKYFQALKNFWIVPMFLCFKRMVSFRKMFEDGIVQRVNFFNLDMAQVDKVQRIKNLEKKLFNENQIVTQELSSLFTQCEKQSQKFEQKELAKIQKFLNLDLNQDIKDIYFVYLYTQVFKTLQNQKVKHEQDPIKLKENLTLQCGTLISLIVSELPFNNDQKILDIDEYERIISDKNYNRQQIETYIMKKEETVQNLKLRLNSKGIKI